MGERTLIHYSITPSLPLITQCYKYFWCCVGKKRCENGGCFPPVKDDPNHREEGAEEAVTDEGAVEGESE